MRCRYLTVIVGISLLLHLAVFWPSHEEREKASPAVNLSIRLLPIVSDGEVSALPKVVGGDEDLQSSGHAGARSLSDGGGPTISPVRRGSDRRKSTVRGLEQRIETSRAERAASHAEELGEVVSKGAQAIAGVGFGDDAGVGTMEGGALMRYRIALAAAAVGMQAALRAGDGQTGTAVVEVRISRVVGTPTVTLVHSSGVDQVDHEAVALLARAVRSVPVNLAGAGADVVLRMPVVFDSAGH